MNSTFSFNVDENPRVEETNQNDKPYTIETNQNDKSFLSITFVSKERALQNIIDDHPWLLCLISIFIAIVYVILPQNYFWVYSLLKQQLWIILSLITQVEIFELSLVDTPSNIYIASYISGFFISPIIFVIAFFTGHETNSYISICSVTMSALSSMILYGYSSMNRPNNVSITELRPHVSVPFDTFSASVIFAKEDIDSLSQVNRETSEYRQSWIRDSILFTDEPFSSHIKSSDTPNIDKTTINTLMNSNENNNNMKLCSNWWKIFPKYMFSFRNKVKPVLIGNRFIQFLLATFFIILYCLNYYFLIFFTLNFRRLSIDVNGYERVGLFGIYVIINMLFRISIKRLGLSLDRRKKGSASLYFIGETISLYFYYTFYRILFESIGWKLFFVFQIIHLLSEWFVYPFRASNITFELFKTLEAKYLCLNGLFIPPGTNHNDWLQFIALDFAIRLSVMITTGFGILLLLIVVEYLPYNSSGLKQSANNLVLTSEFIIIALVFECLNALLINRIFFQPLHISILSKFRYCYEDHRFGCICVMIGAVLIINPFFVFINQQLK